MTKKVIFRDPLMLRLRNTTLFLNSDKPMTDEKAYLEELTKQLDKSIEKLQDLDPDEPVNDETYEILQEALSSEKKLRQNYDIGVRFNILKSQLETLFGKVEKEVGLQANKQTKATAATNQLPDDETLVYVSLFNSQGAQLKSWQNLLLPKTLYEHSVNRPIYSNQKEIDEMLQNKSNKEQNAYLIIAVKKNDIMANEQTTTLRDPNGFPLLRLKQGAFKCEKIKGFVHKNKLYKVTKEGELIL